MKKLAWPLVGVALVAVVAAACGGGASPVTGMVPDEVQTFEVVDPLPTRKGSTTPSPVAVWTPSRDLLEVQALLAGETPSPEQLEAMAQLFWLHVEALGGDSTMDFETAKNFFTKRMLGFHTALTRGLLEDYGIDSFKTVPFCVNVWGFVHEVAMLDTATTAAEAAPFTYGMIDFLRWMDQEVQLVARGETTGRLDEAMCEQIGLKTTDLIADQQ